MENYSYNLPPDVRRVKQFNWDREWWRYKQIYK